MSDALEEISAGIINGDEIPWENLGQHNFEVVYRSEAEKPWVAYNRFSNVFESRSYATLEEMAGTSLDQYIAIFEVEK